MAPDSRILISDMALPEPVTLQDAHASESCTEIGAQNVTQNGIANDDGPVDADGKAEVKGLASGVAEVSMNGHHEDDGAA